MILNGMTGVILVTGSRAWNDAWAVKEKLDAAVADAAAAGMQAVIVRHGACYPPYKGRQHRPHQSADYLAHLWCRRFGAEQPVRIIEQPRPADWAAECRPSCSKGKGGKSHRYEDGRRSTCPAAGNYRNEGMIREEPRPDLGLAFILDNSRGASHCVKKMLEAGINVDPIYRYSQPEPPKDEGARCDS